MRLCDQNTGKKANEEIQLISEVGLDEMFVR